MNTPTPFLLRLRHSSWSPYILALCAGSLLPFSLAPYGIWPLGMVSATSLLFLIKNANQKCGFLTSFLFGVGLYANGASWVYVAIHDFGLASPTLAFALTSIFVLGLALVFAFPFVIFTRYFSRHTFVAIVGFSAIWTLGEWSRSWFLTGFPWLYVGYAHIDTWLAGWAPITGVFGLSFFAVLSGCWFSQATILSCWRYGANNPPLSGLVTAIVGLGVIWGIGALLHQYNWQNESDQTPISIAVVQPNIPLENKWDPDFLDDTLSILREESSAHWDKDIIVWPEAAIPLMYHDAQEFLNQIHDRAIATNTGLITGILYDDQRPGVYYNSIIGLGRAQGIYFKQRLVPFGEYVPLEAWLRGLIAFFDLPNSVIYPGPKQQEILGFDDKKIAPTICYEIVYPDLVANLASEAVMIVTISNDAWFGSSIGPVQHFQMARMRALENQLHVIRSTNTGISGVINPKGKTTLIGKQFQKESIVLHDIKLHPTSTLFTRFGSWPTITLLLLTLVTSFVFGSARRQKQKTRVSE